MRKGDATDPKGLIAESFKIDGITYEECRSIFLDWALAVPVDSDSQELITTLLERHPAQGHPMRQVLEEGLAAGSRPRRRGGWKGRRS
jgi:hypothetical protein